MFRRVARREGRHMTETVTVLVLVGALALWLDRTGGRWT